MSLVEQTLFGTEDKVANSIELLRTFEPPEGYYVAFSGGKDSVVIKKLCDLAGVKSAGSRISRARGITLMP